MPIHRSRAILKSYAFTIVAGGVLLLSFAYMGLLLGGVVAYGALARNAIVPAYIIGQGASIVGVSLGIENEVVFVPFVTALALLPFAVVDRVREILATR